jgi:sterol desaturase/sphingolipid hydroxylase (fatty acid hydroxylase superfamily)
LNGQFPNLLAELFRLAAWLAVLSAIFVPFERLFALEPKSIFRQQIAVDLGYYFLNGLVPGLLLAGPVALMAIASHHLIPGDVSAAISAWPLWLRVCAAMLVGETGYYWAHRMTHEVPFLWRFHAVHHSAEHIDFMVNTRAHPVDLVFTRLCMLAPLFALGLVSPMRTSDGVVPLIVLFAGMMWGYFVHANVRWRLGPLEWLISSPAFHHWHHTMGEQQRNCNYASMLPWLDRIFGTHHLPKEWPALYGIPEPMAATLLGQLVQPLREPPRSASPSEGGGAAIKS